MYCLVSGEVDLLKRAYYSETIKEFLAENPLTIFGQLANQHRFDLDDQQKLAWGEQIRLLKLSLLNCDTGHLFFEFTIPRMGKRVDVILLIKGIVFVIEFKVGEKTYPPYALNQVLDYSLDIKNFHGTSHDLPIVPILVATDAKAIPCILNSYPDKVYQPLRANASTIGEVLHICLKSIQSPISIDANEWEAGQYKPTPTIIEAAQALYRGHNVKEISRSDSGAINLSQTSMTIDRIIERTKLNHQKAISFITGVPGAGKTLAGLNIANRRLQTGQNDHAVFLSGNGPLVKVLREALIQDEISKGVKRSDAARKAEAFIQNIHHFRDEYLNKQAVPLERVVIFDEAQRAWSLEKTADFMKRKRGQSSFNMSEPEFLISVLDRHKDWAVIICLVGGGQEINTGEAGLEEWFYVLEKTFHHWQIYVSQQITDTEYLMEKKTSDFLFHQQPHVEDQLHLAVSIRSYRSEKVSLFVKSLLDCDLIAAQKLYSDIANNYPISLTRDLSQVRNWLRQRARGSERYGILASSGAVRLRPEGIFVKSDIAVEHWFLKDRQDIRSSNALEEVATEFDIQGLELDWTAVAWDADLRYINDHWEFYSFKGSKWLSIKDRMRKLYLKNSYRVLLTRARQGMIIFVPYGDEEDFTRDPSFYEGTYNYFNVSTG